MRQYYYNKSRQRNIVIWCKHWWCILLGNIALLLQRYGLLQIFMSFSDLLITGELGIINLRINLQVIFIARNFFAEIIPFLWNIECDNRIEFEWVVYCQISSSLSITGSSGKCVICSNNNYVILSMNHPLPVALCYLECPSSGWESPGF